jgi:hypothetical protein
MDKDVLNRLFMIGWQNQDYTIVAENGNKVVRLDFNKYLTINETDTIAELIAQAPETLRQRDLLLEACKNLLFEIDKPDYPTHTGMALIYKDELKQAIAECGGE